MPPLPVAIHISPASPRTIFCIRLKKRAYSCHIGQHNAVAEYCDATPFGSGPKVPVGIGRKRFAFHAGEVAAVEGIRVDSGRVQYLQPILRSGEPDTTCVVLRHGIHAIAEQAVFFGVMDKTLSEELHHAAARGGYPHVACIAAPNSADVVVRQPLFFTYFGPGRIRGL